MKTTVHISDSSTGEIIDEQEEVDYSPGDKAIMKSKEKLEEEKEAEEKKKRKSEYIVTHVLKFNRDKHYGKFFDVGQKLSEELTPAELSFFICLTSYVGYNDGILRPYGSKLYRPFNSFKEISVALGRKYKVCCKQMKSLIDKQIIGTTKYGKDEDLNLKFVCNPFVFFKGKDLDRAIYDIFLDSKWAKYVMEENK